MKGREKETKKQKLWMKLPVFNTGILKQKRKIEREREDEGREEEIHTYVQARPRMLTDAALCIQHCNTKTEKEDRERGMAGGRDRERYTHMHK